MKRSTTFLLGLSAAALLAFTSFSQAADENAYSRILIGFHFRKSVEEGTNYGRDIGRRAANLYMRPVQ